MSTITSKKPGKTTPYKRAKALAVADRRAECNISYGHGTYAEALEGWKFFQEGFPSLAPHVGQIEWMKRYRSHPQWAHLRACGASPAIRPLRHLRAL